MVNFEGNLTSKSQKSGHSSQSALRSTSPLRVNDSTQSNSSFDNSIEIVGPLTRSRRSLTDYPEDEDDGNEGNADEDCYDDAACPENELGFDSKEHSDHIILGAETVKFQNHPPKEVDDEEYDDSDLRLRVLALGFSNSVLDKTEPDEVPDEGWKKAVLGKSVVLRLTNPKSSLTSNVKAFIGKDEMHTHSPPVFRGKKELMQFRCKCRTYNDCDAWIKVNRDGKIIESSGNHRIHCDYRLRAAFWDQIRRIFMEEPNMSSDDIYEEAIKTEVCPKRLLPLKSTVRRAIYDIRSPSIPKTPKDVMNITLDNMMFSNIKLFEKTFNFENGSVERMIVLGNSLTLQALAESTEISCDGTAISSSPHFRQMFILHGNVSAPDPEFHLAHDKDVRLRNALTPLVYVFTTVKSQQMFEAFFNELKELIQSVTDEPWLGPTRFLCDIDVTISNALKKVSWMF